MLSTVFFICRPPFERDDQECQGDGDDSGVVHFWRDADQEEHDGGGAVRPPPAESSETRFTRTCGVGTSPRRRRTASSPAAKSPTSSRWPASTSTSWSSAKSHNTNTSGRALPGLRYQIIINSKSVHCIRKSSNNFYVDLVHSAKNFFLRQLIKRSDQCTVFPQAIPCRLISQFPHHKVICFERLWKELILLCTRQVTTLF